MATSQGVNAQLRFKRQASKGTLAGTSLGQILRRKQATFELQKDTYDTSGEITSTQQIKSVRHGVRKVAGAISGLLSPGTYSDLIGALLRRDFAAVTASTSVGITVAGAGPTYTLTRGAGSWLTDGYKVGMVVRLSVGSLNAANISKNLLITAIGSATVMTVQPVNGVAMVAEGPITGCTVTATGKSTYVPTSGHTNIYYTFETWEPGVPSSEVNQDVQIGQAQFTLPGSGNAEISFDAVGLDQTKSASVYFTSPTAETSTDVAVAASGILYVNGAAVANVTDLNFTINGNVNPADGVVGSNVRPDVFRGNIQVDGSFTAYFDSTTIPNLFLNETAIAIVGVLAAGASATADFISYAIPQVKLKSDTPDDNETGRKRTYNFTAIYNSTGGSGQATEQTTILIQDSAA